jgi:myo-inositol-1(or 4)-monophosphatase
LPVGFSRALEIELPAVEAFALELAREAGEAIARAVGAGGLAVSYKDTPRPGRAPVSVVSEVDRAVEAELRRRIAGRFPSHGVIGEEIAAPAPEGAWLWVLDPVDGTANFVNGLPLFACSIGVLHDGEPVAGAIWCAATHRLRPGVYHGRCGGSLGFEGEALRPWANPGVLRRLAGVPPREAARGRAVDPRVTGSAATECAWVAAGLLRYTILRKTSIWDVAGGVALARAAGVAVREPAAAGWQPFERFAPGPRDAELRAWRGTLLFGEPDPEEMPEP